MKKIIMILILGLSSNSFANSHGEIDTVLRDFLAYPGTSHYVEMIGKNSDGHKCKVSRIGRQVSIVNYAPGCIRQETSTVNPGCLSDFEYQYAKLKVLKMNVTANAALLEIRSKDSEVYSSSQSSKLEMSRTVGSLSVKLSSDKGLFTGYQTVLDCYIN